MRCDISGGVRMIRPGTPGCHEGSPTAPRRGGRVMPHRSRAALIGALSLPVALAGTLATGVAAAGAASPPVASPAHRSLVVMTDRGAVRGAASDRVERCPGVPYAAVPLGSFSWTAPGTPPAWSSVRDPTRFGNP